MGVSINFSVKVTKNVLAKQDQSKKESETRETYLPNICL